MTAAVADLAVGNEHTGQHAAVISVVAPYLATLDQDTPTRTTDIESDEQREEVEALQAIFGDDVFCLLAATPPPVRFSIQLADCSTAGDDTSMSPPPHAAFSLLFSLPEVRATLMPLYSL
jgi:hypothetical protein